MSFRLVPNSMTLNDLERRNFLPVFVMQCLTCNMRTTNAMMMMMMMMMMMLLAML